MIKAKDTNALALKRLVLFESYLLRNLGLSRPEAGALIKGGAGLRKIRWNANNTGKRGGIRVIYYLDLPDRFFMLYAYKKNQQEDLSPSQIKILKQVVSEWLL